MNQIITLTEALSHVKESSARQEFADQGEERIINRARIAARDVIAAEIHPIDVRESDNLTAVQRREIIKRLSDNHLIKLTKTTYPDPKEARANGLIHRVATQIMMAKSFPDFRKSDQIVIPTDLNQTKYPEIDLDAIAREILCKLRRFPFPMASRIGNLEISDDGIIVSQFNRR